MMGCDDCMSVSFSCEKCGKHYTVKDRVFSRYHVEGFECKCGHQIINPIGRMPGWDMI